MSAQHGVNSIEIDGTTYLWKTRPAQSEDFEAWVSILTYQTHNGGNDLNYLAADCTLPDDRTVLLLLIEALIQPRLEFRSSLSALGDDARASVDLEVRAEDHWFNQAICHREVHRGNYGMCHDVNVPEAYNPMRSAADLPAALSEDDFAQERLGDAIYWNVARVGTMIQVRGKSHLAIVGMIEAGATPDDIIEALVMAGALERNPLRRSRWRWLL